MKQAANMCGFEPDRDLLDIVAARPRTTDKHDPALSNVTIYTIPPSLCSQRVRMTLLEKHIAYREHTIDTASGENLTPAARFSYRGVIMIHYHHYSARLN